MAPKKNAEKSLVLKSKKGVRKKPATAKTLTGNKLDMPSIVNFSISNDDIQVPEMIPQKPTKAQLAKRIKGVKTTKGCEAINNIEDVPSTIKRRRNNNKIRKKLDDEEVDDPCYNPKTVPAKTRKKKAAFKQNVNEIKIMLANEVIRSAFQKRPIEVKKPARLGRPKRIVSIPSEKLEIANNENTIIVENHENIQDVAKKKAVEYVYSRKRTSTVPLGDGVQKQLDTVTSETSVTVEMPKRNKLSLKRKILKPITKKTPENMTSAKEGKEEMQKSAPIDIDEGLCSSNQVIAPDFTCKINKEKKLHNSGKISSRKHSGTSTSTCLSWTKHISSSSTTTCVTVKSDDFVRIDKKLPIIKLTNVDHKIQEKHPINNIHEENYFDSIQNKPHSPSNCSNVSNSNLNISQTLNLSTSSLTSVTSDRTAQEKSASQENKDLTIIKLQQSLKNLSSKMKNFDLEIINWIGYENENMETNAKKFYTRILEVLHDENVVIKYCEDIQRVSVGDNHDGKSNNIIEEYPNYFEVTPFKADENSKPNNLYKNVIGESNKQNTDIFVNNSESIKENDKNIIPAQSEIFNHNTRISFDKEIDNPDNDDDDALSLFAESITGLESSRKNSPFVNSVSNVAINVKSTPRIDWRESRRVTEHVCQSTSNGEINEEPTGYPIINNVEKHTADSSTVSKRCNKIDESKTDNNRSYVNISNRFSDKYRMGQYLRFNNDDFKNISRTFANINSNSVEFPDTDVSPVVASESPRIEPEFANSSNRSSEDIVFPNTFVNNSINYSKNICAQPGNVSENLNNRTNDILGNTSNESVSGAENDNFSIPDVEAFKKPVAYQLTLDNKQINVAGTLIFKNVCIFNLVSKCKSMFCNFPHVQISTELVKNKLRAMDERKFIKELMYLLKWTILKYKYGMCYVEECIRRNMTIWLLNMVKDFLVKGNRNSRDEETFFTEVIEATLLHINDSNIASWSSILRSKIKHNIYMCDHFMKVISETQNFSRFKNIFIKLTLFMCDFGRSFRLDVATQFLERLCILPYDDALAHALMKIIEKTNPNIFSVSMMGLLENQLLKNNMQLYNVLMTMKLETVEQNKSLPPSPMHSPHIASPNVGHQSTPVARADSPDTTNMDFMTKSVEPVIIRTVNTSRLNMNAGSESSEETVRRYEPWRLESAWRNKPPSLLSMRVERPRKVYKQFLPRVHNGTHPKYRRKPPHQPY